MVLQKAYPKRQIQSPCLLTTPPVNAGKKRNDGPLVLFAVGISARVLAPAFIPNFLPFFELLRGQNFFEIRPFVRVSHKQLAMELTDFLGKLLQLFFIRGRLLHFLFAFRFLLAKLAAKVG
jgi:hypothetical protein